MGNNLNCETSCCDSKKHELAPDLEKSPSSAFKKSGGISKSKRGADFQDRDIVVNEGKLFVCTAPLTTPSVYSSFKQESG
jgi:hypothetical protein